MTQGYWQLAATELYDSVQKRIPEDWRLPDELLAKAWVLPKDVDPNTVKPVDTRDIAESSGVMSAKELAITESTDLEALQCKLASREYTSYEVTLAFCKRAALSQQLTRSCTELLFDRALERARELDEHLAETGKVIGPLHGIPISVKDCVNIKGYTSTIGLAGWTTKLATSNSVIFDILEKQGAVIHVKTNVPQSMMVGETATVESVALFVAESNVSKAGETVNVIWGRCSPPFDRTRVAGGSSGGECSLIAFKGSLLGVGTDIGTFGWHPFHRKGGVAASLIHHALAGSVRIPAAMCGVYSLKPSSGRIPYYGQVGVGRGGEFIAPVSGPIASSVKALEIWMGAVLAVQPQRLDPIVTPLPWIPYVLPKKLRIGIVRHNGIVRPHPPIVRVIDQTAELLKAQGHEVYEWEAGDLHREALRLAFLFFLQDGGKGLGDVLAQTGEPRMPALTVGVPETERTAEEVMAGAWDLNELRMKYLQRWTAANMDAMITPTCSHVAAPHGHYNDVSNTVVFNALNYSAAVIPAGFVDPMLDQPREDWNAYEPNDISVIEGGKKVFVDAKNHALYKNAEDWKGLPITIQVACRQFEEEKTLAIAAYIDRLIHGSSKPLQKQQRQ